MFLTLILTLTKTAVAKEIRDRYIKRRHFNYKNNNDNINEAINTTKIITTVYLMLTYTYTQFMACDNPHVQVTRDDNYDKVEWGDCCSMTDRKSNNSHIVAL